MFSSRLEWDLRPNRLSAALADRRAAGGEILDLTESNPTRAGFAYPGEEILAALAQPRSLLYEPHPAGSPAARAAVSAWYAARGCVAGPERILLASSTSESYSWLFKLLADPGDEVLVPRPSYPLFEFLARLEAVRLAHYPLVYDGAWAIDFEALEAAVTPRTRAVILVNPNNPTGSFLKCAELERLAALCRDRELAIISDEVFATYTFGEDPRRVATLAGFTEAPVFAMSGLSKVAGLPQMKLGWIVAGGPGASEARERLELIADTYLSVGTPVQNALPRLLAAGEKVERQIAARVRGNLDALRAAIAPDSVCNLLEVEGGWYATVRVPRTRTEEEWCLELLGRGVLLQPGYFYDFDSEAFLVLSLLTPADVFRQGIACLAAL